MKDHKKALADATSRLKELRAKMIYAAVGKIDKWGLDDQTPTQDDGNDYRDVSYLRQVNPNHHSLVVRRIDWQEGKVFSQNQKDGEDFYCVTKQWNVYRCLDNAGGQPSRTMPSFIGTGFTTLIDGYIWEYLYTISPDDRKAFATPDYIPVPDEDDPVRAAMNQGGSVSRIDVIQGGRGYGQSTFSVTGGTKEAILYPKTHPYTGAVESFFVGYGGDGYQNGTVVVHGEGEELVADVVVVKPSINHAETLFANHAITSIDITADDYMSPVNAYRKFLLVDGATRWNDMPAGSPRYNNTTTARVEDASAFVIGEGVKVGNTTAVVHNKINNTLYLTGVTGDIRADQGIEGVLSGATSTVRESQQPSIKSFNVIHRIYREPFVVGDDVALLRFVWSF